ncbi:MAG: hypothetical protein K1V90_03555 [Muribaculaceae bacterium]|jgi:heme/copper-type cytochrome/quinol oxidase subunit 4
MQLDELKKSMSTLEQVLAKTNSDIKIDVSTSQTAKSKILNKFRQGFVSCIILAVVFTAMALGNVETQSFPNYLKIGMAVCLAVGAVWYVFIYFKLNRIDIAALTPANLFSKTANIKLMMISGEVFFIVCLVVFFTLLFQSFWSYNQIGFWAMAATLLFAIVYGIVYMWPQYMKLFRDLNSIKE